MVGGAADWKMLENECLIKETRLLPLTHITFPSLSLLSLSLIPLSLYAITAVLNLMLVSAYRQDRNMGKIHSNVFSQRQSNDLRALAGQRHGNV